MREKIIDASIQRLKREGLKFSVDALSDELKISKKTVYKYFPDKETLAMAIYKKYYSDTTERAEQILKEGGENVFSELLRLYFDSKMMIRGEIFNKYKLNEVIYRYAAKQNDLLWNLVSRVFPSCLPEKEKTAIRTIVDGSFERLCTADAESEIVLQKLVKLLW